MDTFMVSSFGSVVMGLFPPLFRASAWQTFSLLAGGWVLAAERHTITTSLWLTGATTLKPFSRFSVFLGGPLYQVRWQLWAQVIRHGATWVDQHAPIVLALDDFTKKKAGRHIAGLDRSRHRAGSARQEYRPLRGVTFVLGVMRLPLEHWPGPRVTLPIGLALSLQAPLAHTLRLASRSRSTLARESVDWVAKTLPERPLRGIADGGDATKDCLRHFPPAAHVVARLLISAQLSALPTPSKRRCPGRPPRQGQPLGSPKTFARKKKGWRDPPSEVGAQVQAWGGRWHSVLPGRPIRVVGVRRKAPPVYTAGQRKPRPRVEAFFTTDLTLRLAAILAHYRDRWAVAIDIRDGQAFSGLGQAQCRKWQRMVGATTCRLGMAAARTLWCVAQPQHPGRIDLCRYRPWYRHQVAPSQLDIVSMCRETLPAAGVSPRVRFCQAVAETHEEPENTMPLAA